MIDKLKNLWGGRAFNILGFLAAVALGALIDWKTPSGHLAVWVPMGIAALTEVSGVFGKFDAVILNPRTRNLLLAGIGALATYLTSNPAVSNWRYAPIALALVFSAQRVLGTRAAPVIGGILMLLGITLPQQACAHLGPLVEEFRDCSAPEVAQICHEVTPRVIDALACAGLDPALAPMCAAIAIEDLYSKHGHAIVNCALIAIRDAFKVNANAEPEEIERARLIRARAGEQLRREEARGVKLPKAGP